MTWRTNAPWLALFVLACGAPTSPTLSASRSPGEMAIEVLEVGIGQARPDVIRPLIGEDYRQHNPRVPDGPGGLLAFVTEFSRRPVEQRVGVRVLRALEDGEFAATHSEYRRGDRRISGFDVFRARDGRLVEHWDVGMRERGSNPSGHGLLDGARPDAASLASGTEATRARVERFVDEGLIARDASALEESLAPRCVQHAPGLADGRAAWIASLAEGSLVHEQRVRTIAQGRWALTQSRGTRAGEPVVVNDLFRLEGARIAERWVVWERIPERMAHSNGML